MYVHIGITITTHYYYCVLLRMACDFALTARAWLWLRLLCNVSCQSLLLLWSDFVPSVMDFLDSRLSFVKF